MKNGIKLLFLCLIVFILSACVTKETQVVVHQPVLPPISAPTHPGYPVANGDEGDELEIILKQAHTVEDLWLWIVTVQQQIAQLGPEEK